MIKFSYILYLTGLVAGGFYFLSQKVKLDLTSMNYEDLLKVLDPFWVTDLFKDEILFTKQRLAEYDGVKRKELYLSILGKVYDVSKGKKYYGPGEGYNGFVGRDASKAFVTGDFTPAGLNSRVLELHPGELDGLLHWVELYEKNYVYKGKLIGRFYNEDGSPTEYLTKVLETIDLGNKEEEAMKDLDRKYPPCNLEWNAEHGKIVWCSTRSGGIERDWAGVPRKFFLPDSDYYRCACVRPEDPPVENEDGVFREYGDCPPDSDKCYLRLDDEE